MRQGEIFHLYKLTAVCKQYQFSKREDFTHCSNIDLVKQQYHKVNKKESL